MDIPESLLIDVVRADKATSAIIYNDDIISEETHLADGLALLSPKDSYNKEIGAKLAVSRALIDLGNRMQREAQGMVKHSDNMRVQRKEQKQRNTERQAAHMLAKTEAKAEAKAIKEAVTAAKEKYRAKKVK